MEWWLLLGGAGAFCLLAILNSGGYRYGVSDQAFYIPAALRHLNSELFPRDRSLIEAQSLLMLFDDGVGGLSQATGMPLPSVFFLLFLFGLLLLVTGVVLVGRQLYTNPWTTVVLALALTFRHQIPKVSVNTLEGYLHPRSLAFAVGVIAVAVFLRGRPWRALGFSMVSGLLHPTIALMFALWIGLAIFVAYPRTRRLVISTALACAALGAWWLWVGPGSERAAQMDPLWIRALADKDYFFPTEWPATTWLLNAAYPVLVVLIYGRRRAAGVASDRERALVVGCLGLIGIFVASLPFIAARIALAVQLQVPRVFWMADFLATIYVAWWLTEKAGSRWGRVARPALAVFLAAAAMARGGYVTFVEHPGRPLARVGLPTDEWHDVMNWMRRTPVATHVLADPGHAWRYGSSVRVAAERDVYTEEVKDTAIAAYSRAVAERVVRRLDDLGDFQHLTAGAALALADKYALDYLVTERPMNLPLAYRNTRFRVYRLRDD